MAEHLQFSEGLKVFESHKPIFETYLGQAHIAGTGPEGKTCRECVFWCPKKYTKINGSYVERVVTPGYFGKKNKAHPGEIKKAKCTKPILNKANRLIPHSAKACRLFEQSENPPEAIRNA